MNRMLESTLLGGGGLKSARPVGVKAPSRGCHGMVRVREICPPLPIIGRRVNLGDLRTEELALPLNKCNCPEAGPAPYLSKTVELALGVQM